MANEVKPSACVVVFGVRFLSAEWIDEDADEAMMGMRKIDVAAIEAACRG